LKIKMKEKESSVGTISEKNLFILYSTVLYSRYIKNDDHERTNHQIPFNRKDKGFSAQSTVNAVFVLKKQRKRIFSDKWVGFPAGYVIFRNECKIFLLVYLEVNLCCSHTVKP